MKKSFTLVLIIMTSLLVSGFLISQSVVVYYPLPYEYPDANVVSDDLHLAEYYGRGHSVDIDKTAVGVDDGKAGNPIKRLGGPNSVGIFDKIFSKDSGEIKGDEFIRAYSKVFFINAVPDVSHVSIWLDDYLLTEYLPFSKVTEPVEIQPGNVPFMIEIGGKPTIKDDFNLQAGKEHMIFITGLYGVLTGESDFTGEELKLKATMVIEDPIMNESYASISFFNAVPGDVTGTLNLRVGRTPDDKETLFEGLTYGDYINSRNVYPDNYFIDIVRDGGTKMTNDVEIKLIAGNKYFAVAFAPYEFGIPQKD